MSRGIDHEFSITTKIQVLTLHNPKYIIITEPFGFGLSDHSARGYRAVVQAGYVTTYQSALVGIPVDANGNPLVGGAAPTIWQGAPLTLLDANGNIITSLGNGTSITNGGGSVAVSGAGAITITPAANQNTSIVSGNLGIGIAPSAAVGINYSGTLLSATNTALWLAYTSTGTSESVGIRMIATTPSSGTTARVTGISFGGQSVFPSGGTIGAFEFLHLDAMTFASNVTNKWTGIGLTAPVFSGTAPAQMIGMNIPSLSNLGVAVPVAFQTGGGQLVFTDTQPSAANPGTSASALIVANAAAGGNALSGTNAGGVGGGYTFVTGAGGAGTGGGLSGAWGQFILTTTVGATSAAASSTNNGLFVSQMTMTGLTADFNPNAYDTYVTESQLKTDTGTFNYHGKIRALYPHVDIGAGNGSVFDRVENTASLVNILSSAGTGTLTYGYGISGELLHSSNNYTVTAFDAVYGLCGILANGSVGQGRGGNFNANDTVGQTGTFTTSAIGVTGTAQHSNAQTAPLNIGVQGNSNNGPGTLTQSTGIQAFLTQGTTGTTTTGYVVQVSTPSISGTGVISVITGLRIEPIYNTASNTSTTGGYTAYAARIYVPTQGGHTSGTNLTYGLVIDQGGSSPGVGGTAINVGIQIAVPNPANSGTITNRGLYITGSGTAGATNYAVYCDSTRVWYSAGKFSTYNNVAVTGFGLGALLQAIQTTTTTNATATLATYANPASTATVRVSAHVNVTVGTTMSMSVTVTYTDIASNARTLTLPLMNVTASPTFLLNGLIITTGDYVSPTMELEVKASTTISIQTAGTVTATTYTGSATIEQVT